MTDDFNYTAGAPAPDGSVLIASYNVAADYEVDEGEVLRLADGRYYYRWASGCSCWSGEYYSDVYPDWPAFVMLGIDQDRLAAMEYEPGFEDMKTTATALRTEAEAR